MAMRLRTRITLTFEFITTLTIVVMSVIFAISAIGRIASFYYQQGQMLNLIGQSNIEYALALPDRAVGWAGQQAVITGVALGELVSLSEERAQMSPAEVQVMLNRVIRESGRYASPSSVEGVRITAPSGEVLLEAGSLPKPDELPETYRTALNELDATADKPVIEVLTGAETHSPPRYAVAIPAGEGRPLVEIISSEALGHALSESFDVEDVMARFLLNSEVDRIAIINMNGEVEAAAGESLRPGQPVADNEVVDFCVAFLKEHEERKAFHAKAEGRVPGNDVPFVDFMDVQDDEGVVALGVATLVDSRAGGPPRALFIQHRTTGMVEMIQEGLRSLVVVSLVMVVLAGVAGLLLSRRLARPLVRLAEAAQTISAGNFSYRVPVQGEKEVRILARAFNQMVDSIQKHTIDLQRETKLRERLESDYRIGAEIQRSLLPVNPPEVNGVEVTGWSEPAREVGGDFYDFLKLGPHRLGFTLGDASGKGLPAAILVTECSSVLRALSEERYSLGELLTKTNNALVPRLSESGHFVTLFAAEVNARKDTLYYTVAGHNPPLLVPANGGAPEWLACAEGVPLGIEHGRPYVNQEVRMESGDTLVVYSDGITEARNASGEFYGRKRLSDVIVKYRAESSAKLLDRVIADVRKFMGTAEAADDMSLLVVRRNPVVLPAPKPETFAATTSVET